MIHRPFFILTLSFLLLPLPTWADAPSPPAAPMTLAQALVAAPPPKGDVYLAVAADKVTLPQDAMPPQKDAPASQVAQSYGRIIREFGGVMAVAPPTMTVLNTEPGTPNPYDGMPPGDALKLLLVSLSDAQWKTLIGVTGLGMADLAGDTQSALFGALFPAQTMILHLRHDLESYGQEDETKLPRLTQEDIPQAHLRLGQRVTLGLPTESDSHGHFLARGPSPGGVVRYELYNGSGVKKDPDALYGVRLRATVPNVPKLSDLDYDAGALRARVSLAGIKTVGDLVSRIGATVRLELYADIRYEKRPVTRVGPASARASDLLRALALCVAGTYRWVGPAYVLTDDRIGEGTWRMILTRFAAEAELARNGPVTDAGDRLLVMHSLASLPPLDSELTLSDTQNAGFNEIPLAKMTPAQQEFTRRSVEGWNARVAGQDGTDEEKATLRVTLTKPFTLQIQPTLTLQTPSVSGAILLDNYLAVPADLFQASPKLRAQQEEARQKEMASRSAAGPGRTYTPPPAPALGPLLRRIPRRAVLVQPRTIKAVDALVTAMKTVGLNALWLDVFSGGKSHLDTDPDILTEALAKTKGTGITVFVALDLLRWGADAPEDARDRTLLGETSAQADVHQQRYQAVKYQGKTPEEADKQTPPADLLVCPVASAVQGPLLALVRRLAATEGVAGLVLRDTLTTGYDRPDLSRYGAVGGDRLGYTPGLRLAFLRHAHADPVDLAKDISDYGSLSGAEVALPEFDDYHITASAEKEWAVFRAGADSDMLQRAYAAARPTPTRALPVWIAQRRPANRNDWYGLWAGLPRSLPELSEARAYGGESNTNLPAFAHAQCRVDLYELQAGAASSRDALAYTLQSLPPGWDGFVLDLSDDGGSSALDGLAKSLTPPKPEAAKIPQK